MLLASQLPVAYGEMSREKLSVFEQHIDKNAIDIAAPSDAYPLCLQLALALSAHRLP